MIRPYYSEAGIELTPDTIWQAIEYPLIFTVPKRRSECYYTVESAGLPATPKSSCWCCPHRKNPQWRRLRDNYPADFVMACELDDQIRATDLANGRRGVYLHFSGQPLREVDLDGGGLKQMSFYKIDGCGSGHCWV
jgi:hypothetical protein